MEQQDKPTDAPFIINPETTADNLLDAIDERVLQAHALVMGMTYDDEESDFYTLSLELQGNYIWALARTLLEARQLLDAYSSKRASAKAH